MEHDNVRLLRRSNRVALVLPAKVRSRSGFLDRVVISDLSALGCRIDSLALILQPGDQVVVRPEGLEGLCGVIRWVKNHSAGIEFDRALYAPVVEHLQRQYTHYLNPERLSLSGDGKLRYAA